MDQEKLSKLSGDISDLAQSILIQLNGSRPSFVDQYFIGLLMRITMILNEVSEILRTRKPEHLQPIFILLRPLLDDFIQVLAIFKSSDIEEEINKILADAHNHRLKSIKDSAEFNRKYFDNSFDQFKKQEDVTEAENKYRETTEFDRLFEDKAELRFKKLDTLTSLVRNLDKSQESAANVNAYLVWKFLSQYIHYSNLTYHLDQDQETRELEILQVEEILFYCYKTIVIAVKILKDRQEIKWDTNNPVYIHFKEKISDV